jgi:MoxR-like ATPase
MVASKGPVARLMGDVRACLEVGTVPILWGSPGVGKTQSVLKLFRDMGLIPIVIIGSQCEPTDIAGFPCVMGSTASHDDTPSTRFIPRDFVRKINDHPHNRYGILWDELTCVPTATMSAMLTPLTSWTFGDTQVDPKRVAMVAAANPPDEAVNGQELPPAVRNRLSRFPWSAVARTAALPLSSSAKVFIAIAVQGAAPIQTFESTSTVQPFASFTGP